MLWFKPPLVFTFYDYEHDYCKITSTTYYIPSSQSMTTLLLMMKKKAEMMPIMTD